MSLLAKFKGRGYREVVIRPTKFAEQRVANVRDPHEIVRSKRVGIRGWGVPHYGRQDPNLRKDHIEQEVDFLGYVEAGRLYRSGMFVCLGGLRADWDEQERQPGPRWVLRPGKILGVADTIRILTEAFELAARLSMTAAGSDRMHVAATVHGLEGRKLHMEVLSRHLPPRPPREGLPDFRQAADFTRQHLVSESRTVAVTWAREVFRRFDWDASLGILKGIQEQIGWLQRG